MTPERSRSPAALGARFATLPRYLGLALSVVLAIGLALTPWGRFAELALGDSLFLVRGSLPVPDDLLIVAIDEPSMAELGEPWPWPRRLHAELLDALYSAGARQVLLDILFAEPSRAEDDARLQQALDRHPQTVLAADLAVIDAEGYRQEILVGPWAVFGEEIARIGLISLPLESDGVVRGLRLQTRGLPALALQGAAGMIQGGCCPRLRPDADQVRINFLGPPGSIPTVSYYQALAPDSDLPAGALEGKTVLVGAVSSDLASPDKLAPDHFAVPFSRWGYGYMAGVEIHAHAIHSLARGGQLARIAPTAAVGWAALLSLLLGVVFLRIKPLAGLLGLAAVLTLILSGVYWLFVQHALIVPVLIVMLPVATAFLFALGDHYYRIGREKAFIQNAFSTYLAPAVIERLIAEPERLRPGGTSVTGSVLFLDLAGFTELSEQLSPQALVVLMNRFLEQVVEIVMEQEGMVDKFIGDAVLAVWGAALTQPDHAQRACTAALAIQRVCDRLAAGEMADLPRPLQARIGINSGAMIAGNIGGTRRFDFTVVGDTVNLASRLEGVNKVYGTRILVGEGTLAYLEGGFDLRPIDRIRVKGKRQAVAIFELLEEPLAPELAALFEAALACYRQRNWQQAAAVFRRFLSARRDDGPSRVYLERCEAFRCNPPPDDWDGTFEMLGK